MASKRKHNGKQKSTLTPVVTHSEQACAAAVCARPAASDGIIRRATGVSLETTPPELMAEVVFRAQQWEERSTPSLAAGFAATSDINRRALADVVLPVAPLRQRQIRQMVQAWFEQGEAPLRSEPPQPRMN